ncbi:hypothetical protein LAZ67_2001720 [Cordylochernes scorpioides]|uniref:Integrase catalytic domain-containing protein n=1 Tax=Cordylochernes scorpioides TaxID=51811 RepID=A0ABY6K4N1_9ARAC|nr:hypothetical protein LAZ67_2001720 [Cordylochernes scorpioides]
MYDPNLPCKLYTDASEQGLGAILAQKHPDGRKRVVSYFSKRLNPTQSRYTATELECFAIIEAVRHFNNYLDKPFQIVTDQSALKWLLNHKNPGEDFSDEHQTYTSNNSAAILNILRQLLSSGIPIKRILKDNGSNFTSRSFKNVLLENKIAHSLATPYHPQT